MPPPPSVLTIGNFDGVHIGHLYLMGRVVELAHREGLSPAAMTFDPHPTRVVAPERAPKLLTTAQERAALMRDAGIEHVYVVPFTTEIARMTPEEFVAKFVHEECAARVVVVGENFRFGCKQAGNTETLAALGEKYGYRIEIAPSVHYRGRPASSSEIRRLIAEGNVSMAGRLLDRPYSLEGDVVKGHGIGSKQTVPTLNLSTQAELLPATGVYVTRTYELKPGAKRTREWESISNIGTRPTFDGGALSIETFLLEELRGETPSRIRVEFLRRVREERKFDSPEALKAQILRDVGRAKTYFRRTGSLQSS